MIRNEIKKGSAFMRSPGPEVIAVKQFDDLK